MPIKAEHAHHYRGAAWKEARGRALERAGNCCAWCRKPNGAYVFQITQPVYLWHDALTGEVRNCDGEIVPEWVPGPRQEFWKRAKLTLCVLTTAHWPDPTPENLADENLWALCQRCHLMADHEQHIENAKRTRQAKRAAVQPALPLLTVPADHS